ncbi:MAG: glycosyltransferase family 2 protein [Actinomycetota bacterium]
MRPDVSILVATRNRSSVISRALESVRRQQNVATETVVVDDGSSAAEAAALREVCAAFPGVRLSRLGRSGGPSAARNAALAEATGRYVCALDDDNEFLRDKLESQLGAIDRVPDGVAVSGVEISDDARQPERRMPGLRGVVRLDAEHDPFARLPARVFVHTYLLETELLRRVGGYDPQLRWGEHTELFLRLRRVASFSGVEAIGTRVHRGPDLEHASRDSGAKADGIRRIMDLHAGDFGSSASLRAEWLDVLGVTLLRAGRRSEARRAFAASVAARPLRTSSLRHLVGAATHSERILGGAGG